MAQGYPRAELWGPRILAAITFLFAAALAIGDYRSVRHGVASETWPTTTAITDVRRGGSRTGRFVFRYEVDGVAYESARAGFVMRPMFRPQLEYSDSATVVVRYDPANPSRATLTPGVSWWGLAWHLIAPLGLLAFGVCILRAASRYGPGK